MKTAIPINESDFEKEKREALECLEIIDNNRIFIPSFIFKVVQDAQQFQQKEQPEEKDWKQIESDFYIWTKSKWCPTHEQIFEWLKSAVQSPSEQPEVTDEMIEKWASIGSKDIKNDFTAGAKSFMRGVVFGAKAMRDGIIKASGKSKNII